MNEWINHWVIRRSEWKFLSVIFLLSYVTFHIGFEAHSVPYIYYVAKLILVLLPLWGWLFYLREDAQKSLLKFALPIGVYGIVLLMDAFSFNCLKILDTWFVTKVSIIEMIPWLVGLVWLVTLSEVFLSDSFNLLKINRLNEINLPGLFIVFVIVGTLILLLMSQYLEDMLAEESLVRRLYTYAYYWVQLIVIYGSYYIYYYIHHHLLFNKLLRKKGIVSYGLGIILTLLVIVPIHNWIISGFPVAGDLLLHSVGMVPLILDDFNMGLPISTLLISFPFIVTIEWYKQANQVQSLEKEKSQTELNLLKQQINPHFFFNTLNNLYAMSLTQEAETPETILKLSELMRYVIYRGKEDQVALSEEIRYLEDYLDLQKIRIHKKFGLSFNVEIENSSMQIPPMLFIILVENAFKHGVEPDDGKSYLNISLLQKNQSIFFQIENSVNDQIEKVPPGIGLDNLRQRLQLLFPDRHSLIISNLSTRYIATLKIEV